MEYTVLVGKSEGKRPLGRTRRRWSDNIKTDRQEIRCNDANYTSLYRDQWWYFKDCVRGVSSLIICRPTFFYLTTLHQIHWPCTIVSWFMFEWWIERMWKEQVVTYFNLLSRHLLGATKENHEKHSQVSWSGFERGTSRKRSRSANYSTATFTYSDANLHQYKKAKWSVGRQLIS
jgi:hypothetical protein